MYLQRRCLSEYFPAARKRKNYADLVPEEYRDREILEVTCFYSASYYGVKDVIEEFNASQDEYYALYIEFGGETVTVSGELVGGETLAEVESGYEIYLDSFDRAIIGGEIGDILSAEDAASRIESRVHLYFSERN